jgi:hypothetical protein
MYMTCVYISSNNTKVYYYVPAPLYYSDIGEEEEKRIVRALGSDHLLVERANDCNLGENRGGMPQGLRGSY